MIFTKNPSFMLPIGSEAVHYWLPLSGRVKAKTRAKGKGKGMSKGAEHSISLIFFFSGQDHQFMVTELPETSPNTHTHSNKGPQFHGHGNKKNKHQAQNGQKSKPRIGERSSLALLTTCLKDSGAGRCHMLLQKFQLLCHHLCWTC